MARPPTKKLVQDSMYDKLELLKDSRFMKTNLVLDWGFQNSGTLWEILTHGNLWSDCEICLSAD